MAFSVDDVIHNSPGVQTMWQATGRGGDGGAYYNMRGFIVQKPAEEWYCRKYHQSRRCRERRTYRSGERSFCHTLRQHAFFLWRIDQPRYQKKRMTISVGKCRTRWVAMASTALLWISTHRSTKTKKCCSAPTPRIILKAAWRDYGFNKGFVFAPTLTYKASDRLTFNFDAELYSSSNASRPFCVLLFLPQTNWALIIPMNWA